MQKSSYDVLIEKLDSFIRKYYMNKIIRGSLISLAIIVFLFLVFNILEFEFYFSKGVRKGIFFSFVLTALASLGYLVALPLTRYFRLGDTISHEQAASIIGSHFKDIQDKLLNILQLKKLSGQYQNNELALAGINQKADKIQLVPFQKAIDYAKNKKYLKYAVPPVLALFLILLTAPSMIKDSTFRIINNDQEFEAPAPFSFHLKGGDQFEVLQRENMTIEVETKGDVVPEEAYILADNYQYKLTKNEKGLFSYTFKNVQKDKKFSFQSGKVQSKDYHLFVKPAPQLVNFEVYLDYPNYTKRQDERLDGIGDFIIPQGTRVKWDINTKNTEQAALKFHNSGVLKAADQSDESYTFSKRLMADELYHIWINNEYLPIGDSVQYSIAVVPDKYPTIQMETIQDSTEASIAVLGGVAEDDYGFSKLQFVYSILDAEGAQVISKNVPLKINGEFQTSFDWILDFESYDMEPGQTMSYYIEVFDNDGVNGAKSAKTSVQTYKKASLEEIKEEIAENEEEINEDLDEAIEEAMRLQKEMKKIQDQLLNQKELDFNDKKKIEELLEKKDELQKKLKKAEKKFKENLENEKKLNKNPEHLEKKQEQVQKMFEELQSPEMENLMEKIQELMQELKKENTVPMMKDMQFDQKLQEQKMDRLQELYKQLQVEKEINEKVEELEELAKEQEELKEKTEEGKTDQETLKKEQEEINEKFEKLQKEMEELKKKNDELEYPKKMEDPEGEMKDIEFDLDQSMEQLKKQENDGASQSQQDAANKMKKMAADMQMQMEGGDQEQMQEDIKALRQLLENIVTLSFEEEDLVDNIGSTNIMAPRYVDLVQEQFRIKDDFKLVEDSLQEMSKRVAEIETFVTEKVNEINFNIDNSLEHLEERTKPEAIQNQRFAMKNLNDLALMLSESLKQMQQQMGMMMPGNQACNKPGGKSPKKGDGPMDVITQGQKELNDKMKQMGKKGKSGGEGGNSAKDFAQSAAKQAELRKMLEQLQKERQEQGQGISDELKEIIEQMNQTEIDLVNKQLDNETLKRQAEIETRLLEADKATKEREFDEKRKSETAQQKERQIPPALEEYLQKRKAEIDTYKTISPSLTPYYRQLVEDFYNTLNQ